MRESCQGQAQGQDKKNGKQRGAEKEYTLGPTAAAFRVSALDRLPVVYQVVDRRRVSHRHRIAHKDVAVRHLRLATDCVCACVYVCVCVCV